MRAAAVYDVIGHGYAWQRRSDARIAARLTAALGDAQSVQCRCRLGLLRAARPVRSRGRAIGRDGRPAATRRGPCRAGTCRSAAVL